MQFDIDFVVNNCDVRFDVDFALTIGGPQFASVNLSFAVDTLFSGSCNYGYASIPALQSIGGVIPEGYGCGEGSIPSLVSDGEGGFYIPPELEYGFAYLPCIDSNGTILTSSPGAGSSMLPAFQSRGGEGNYGEATGTLPVMFSYASEGPVYHTAEVPSYCLLYDGIVGNSDQIVFINSYGYITDTITGSKEYIASILGTLSATGTISVIGTFTISVSETGALQSSTQGLIVSGGLVRPGVNTESRVWVVNIDTGASSQYDNYGFNSFIEGDDEDFGLAEDGIYRLDGATDAGFDIPWTVDFGSSDCGVSGRKKILNVHIDTTDGSSMYMKIDTEYGTQTYRVEECNRGATGWRVKIPNNVQGTMWNFTLIANNAAELTGIEFTPAKLSRRL